MATKQFVLSIDQGTSGTKAIIFDECGTQIAKATEPLQTLYPENGFVEQDPEAIFQNVLAAVKNCINHFQEKGGVLNQLVSVGISNQRETFMLWDEQGKPLHNAIVWQCKRSIKICERLKAEGHETRIKQSTGLIIDPYFSGTKLMWLNENVPSIQKAIKKGKAFFGTVDTWLLYKLTHGERYFTDHTNASRVLFFNLEKLQWDESLLELFDLEGIRLPEVKTSAFDFGETDFEGLLPQPLKITGMIGDSHAAAFGEGCYTTGSAKVTLGTGSSILMNIGSTPAFSEKGMLTTICWSLPDRVDYAFEGVIVSCGSTLEWFKHNLGLFADSQETEAIALSVSDNNGVYVIPAFSGMGAPYWQMDRKASITGLTFDCTKAHIVRAALESIAYQIKDVIVTMEKEAGVYLDQLMTDGGLGRNGFVMQFLADLLNKRVVRPGIADLSALGAAYIAGLKAGVYKDLEQMAILRSGDMVFEPVSDERIEEFYQNWKAHF